MNSSKLISELRRKTRASANSLSDANAILLFEEARDYMFDEIRRLKTGAFDRKVYTTLKKTPDVVTGQLEEPTVSDSREYQFQDEIYSVQSVQANFDGQGFVRVLPIGVKYTQRGKTWTEDSILSTFGKGTGNCYYEIISNALYLYSGQVEADVENGLVILATLKPQTIELATDTQDLSIPRTPVSTVIPESLHRMWIEKAVISWKEDRDKPLKLTQDEQLFYPRLSRKLRELSENEFETVMRAELPWGSDPILAQNGYNL